MRKTIRIKTVKSKTVKSKTARLMAFMLMLCFFLTACGSEQGSDAESMATGPVAAGDDYRDFTAVLVDGSTFTLSEHEGSVILLNFWATWCGPCVGEMPAFSRLVEKYGDDLTLLAVDLGENAETVERFLDKNGYEFPVALDPDGEIGSLYPSDGIPYTVLIGRDGKIAATHLGADKADVMYENYCSEIDTLLTE